VALQKIIPAQRGFVTELAAGTRSTG